MKLTQSLILPVILLSAICARATSVETQWADSVMSLDEVSVTAIKQSASLLRQPVAVTTVGREEIDRQNVAGLKGLSDLVPNFYMPDYGSRMTSSVYVRGIGARIDQPAVGLNVDNIPYLNKNGFDVDMLDIERIEVLRGPQSTLYGRNTIAGIINIYTLSPLAWQGVRVLAEGSLPGAWRAGVGVYGRLAPTLGMSVNAYGSHSHPLTVNRHNGADVGGGNDYSMRWRTQWRPSESLSLENTFSASSSRQSGYPYEYEEIGEVNYNDTCFYKRTLFTDGMTLRWNGPGFTISSITGLQWLSDNMTLDQDFLSDSYFTLTQRQRERSVTQDIVVSGSHGKYSWLGGVFAFYKHNRMSAPVTFKEDGIARLIVDKANQTVGAMGMRLEWDEDAFVLGSDFMAPVKGFALYHRSTLDVGPLTLSGSLRFDLESTVLRYHSHVATSASMYMPMSPRPITRAIEIDETGQLRQVFRQLLPNVSATWNLMNSAVYVSVAKGYKAGGFNTQMFSNVLQEKMMSQFGGGGGRPGASASADESPEKDKVSATVGYRPEVSWNYEVGGHFSCDDGRVYSTLSAFLIDVRDQQVTVFPEGTGTGRMMANAGRTRSIGAELSLSYTPVKVWRFDLSYGYTHAEFRHFFDGHDDLSGKRVPYVPSNTLYLSAVYTCPLAGCPWAEAIELSPSLRGTGSIYWDEENSARQPFYAQLGCTATLKAPKWELELWGRNLTDTRYTVFRYESMENTFFQRGRGISGGMTLRVRLAR